MKTYEDMAQSVLRRAKAHKAVQRRCVLAVTVVLCLCGICVGTVLMNRPEPEAPVTQLQQSETRIDVPKVEEPVVDEPMVEEPVVDEPAVKDPAVNVPEQNGRVTFLSTSGKKTVTMRDGVILPLQMEIRLKDLRGMTAAEQDAVIQAEKQHAEDIIEANGADQHWGPGYLRTQIDVSDYLLTTTVAGHFCLGMEGYEDIESICFETGGAIQLCHLPAKEDDEGNKIEGQYWLEGRELKSYFYYYPVRGYTFTWMPNWEVFHEMATESAVDLTRFSDSIKVVLTFKDGTVETHQIDIVVTQDGKTSAIYRSKPVGM